MPEMGNDSCGSLRLRSRQGISVTLGGAFLNLLLAGAKLAAGLMGNSRALVADAVHSLSDLGSDLVVLGGLRLAARPEDHTHRYGHGKYETLAALALGVLLALAGVAIAVSAVRSGLTMLHGEAALPPRLVALAAAGVSILVKEVMFRWTRAVAKRIGSAVVMANALHHRSDALSSVATLVGVAGAILLGEKARILDPIAALVVAGMILVAAFGVLRTATNELLEAAVEPDVERGILNTVRGVPGARNPHQLRTRRVGCRLVIDLHIEVDPLLSLTAAHEISSQVEESLLQAFGQETIVYIHVEPDAHGIVPPSVE